jgi:hypothetical protein
MKKEASPAAQSHQIEVKVAEVHQLFNSMDPSPFHERDLDHDAEQFIVSWAQECPKRAPIRLVVHLTKPPSVELDAQKLVSEGAHNYFEYRAAMILRDFKQLMKEGRASLAIGVLFLIACTAVAGFLAPSPHTWHGIAREGLTIMGWVAMWRPLEIYLYRWWPLLQLKRLYDKLARAEVIVKQTS